MWTNLVSLYFTLKIIVIADFYHAFFLNQKRYYGKYFSGTYNIFQYLLFTIANNITKNAFTDNEINHWILSPLAHSKELYLFSDIIV